MKWGGKFEDKENDVFAAIVAVALAAAITFLLWAIFDA